MIYLIFEIIMIVFFQVLNPTNPKILIPPGYAAESHMHSMHSKCDEPANICDESGLYITVAK